MRKDITDFVDAQNYDVRVSHNGRWIDQKCAPDVISVIADCILDYIRVTDCPQFTTKDVWNNKYSSDVVGEVFKKPGVTSPLAKNEYDKFFQQPMEMFANAGILDKTRNAGRNFYSIARHDILEYISLSERNALFFLQSYINKVLKDCNLQAAFDNFFQSATSSSYRSMKCAFSSFMIKYTPINGEVECNRIFIKVLNPLAFARGTRGTEKGHISRDIVRYDMLMYNRANFRDVFADKPKGVTRKEYLATHPASLNAAYSRYQSAKAKKFLRNFNEICRHGKSEYVDKKHLDEHATHMHHIFPEAEFPSICYFLENLIALTPTQHLNYAHPNGNTQEINLQYQRLLLLAKADRISENLNSQSQDKIYGFDKFLYVLSTGFDDDEINDIADMDFLTIINAINVYYGNLGIA